MDGFINTFFTNFTLSMLIVALILSAVSLVVRGNSLNREQKIEICVSYLFLFTVGVNFLFEFVFYTFFPGVAAGTQGLKATTYQAYLSAAYLGVGILGVVSAFNISQFRIAALVMTVTLYWGSIVTTSVMASQVNSTVHTHLIWNVYGAILVPACLIFFTWMQANTKKVTSTGTQQRV